MSLWQALILGVIEGVTEYLPVSSTGHLLVAQRLLGIAPGAAANAYAIVIQAGAIAAVLGLYRSRVWQMALGVSGRDAVGLRVAAGLAVAFLPAAVLGLAAGDWIEGHLFSPATIAVAWVVGGIVLFALAKRIRARAGTGLESLTIRIALVVGIAQCAALCPGVSRSLATILGGLAAGLSLVAAVEFSFLLGVVTLAAATAYKTLESGPIMLETYGIVEILAGFLVAWLSAVVAVRWMVAWLTRRGFAIFAWWRLLAAAVVFWLIATGRM